MGAFVKAVLLAAALCSVAACGKKEPVTGDKPQMVAESDPDMNEAIRKAQASLDTFLATAAAPPPGTSKFKLKVEVKDGAQSEHFWVIPFAVTAKGFEGTLANEPSLVKTVKEGQLIQFTRAEVSDWGYEKDGRQVGSFTVCALFKTMPKDEVEYYRKEHGFDC
jgi:uncharacterized protein YegJ (DUF2314 family)